MSGEAGVLDPLERRGEAPGGALRVSGAQPYSGLGLGTIWRVPWVGAGHEGTGAAAAGLACRAQGFRQCGTVGVG